jgi:hypothetical protein
MAAAMTSDMTAARFIVLDTSTGPLLPGAPLQPE